ncbi:MAG: HD domain-containing protein [Lachnospiraceae bacterium]|nr:HD domain-containing protein [Lachnospiraceae bacterium]
MLFGFYLTLFSISIILTMIYAVMWHKHFSVHFSLIFAIIPIAMLGYMFYAQADDLTSAVTAIKIIYLGGCFLQLFLMLSVFRVCNIELKKSVTVSLIGCSLLLYLSVLTIGYYPLFYKTVTFKMGPLGPYLAKEYGFMHTLFLVVVVMYFLYSISTIVFSYYNKPDVSNTIIVLLCVTEIITVLSYFAGRSMLPGVELTPVAYVISQALFLLVIRRMSLYDVSDTAIDSIEQTGDTGILAVDSDYRYIGSNEAARAMVPDICNVKVDSVLDPKVEPGSILIPWIETFKKDENNDKFYMKRDNKTYLMDINLLYNGEKKRGYQFIITDDTKNQEYIALINNYNSNLKREVEEKTAHIKEMSDRLILDMAIMVESRDNSTGGHIRRTAECMRILMDEIMKDNPFGLSKEFCKNIIKAAPMHDLGKIAVDDVILRKPGRFTPEEFEEMKKHAAEGARIVHEILKDTDDGYFHQIAENMAHYHHERWDGSGYPEGLKGLNIPIEARIMAIADVYDALVSKRVYKEKMSFEKADAIIMEGMGKHFDKKLEPYYVSARPRLEAYYTEQENNG